MSRAEWFTPVAHQKNYQYFWGKLEDSVPKAVPLDLEPTLSYFNNETTHEYIQEYDLHFNYTKTFPLWDKRKNKDNANYLPDIRENIFEQEKDKPVPVLTSMTYGKLYNVEYDKPEVIYRRQHAIQDFQRRRGVLFPKERKPN
ncbi:uncharacterized protein LOC114329022 [Diabrotica virgifera virgifera]|uniref:Uncharacterized protein LOC114329022 n=1 Tax=Diabrotica virgifera virgifera TaxID=50390 RepID=A0A6P7FG01_DIAVI|nr:uncharacterized protein LOC114329022 [Diabrotica virgifera virgifera]